MMVVLPFAAKTGDHPDITLSFLLTSRTRYLYLINRLLSNANDTASLAPSTVISQMWPFNLERRVRRVLVRPPRNNSPEREASRIPIQNYFAEMRPHIPILMTIWSRCLGQLLRFCV